MGGTCAGQLQSLWGRGWCWYNEDDDDDDDDDDEEEEEEDDDDGDGDWWLMIDDWSLMFDVWWLMIDEDAGGRRGVVVVAVAVLVGQLFFLVKLRPCIYISIQ